MRQRSWRRYRLLSLLICWFCGMLSPAVAFDLATDPTPVIMAQAPSVSELEQQAQSFYQNQQYRQAIAPLQQAHQQYQQQGEPPQRLLPSAIYR
ncbi:MAG: hypothetical protein HC886_17070 [Leptolyngbyaceae cyanobacterium SM1_1_3]|nr:hypothetical protein [Leptolyngbyaceae cyanobacterium SM1_1_3]